MILESGNKILVSHRRLFAQDQRRFFVGECLGDEAGSLIVCQLPETLSVEVVRFELDAGAPVMTDGGEISKK